MEEKGVLCTDMGRSRAGRCGVDILWERLMRTSSMNEKGSIV